MRGTNWAVLAGVVAIGLAGCSGSTSSSGTAEASVVPAATMAAATTAAADTMCDGDAIAEAISTAIGPDEKLVNLDSFECAGDFSYAFATTGPADDNPDAQIGVTIVLKTDGAAWAVQDREMVCGTAEITDGPAPNPTDAAVPEAIWENACQTN